MPSIDQKSFTEPLIDCFRKVLLDWHAWQIPRIMEQILHFRLIEDANITFLKKAASINNNVRKCNTKRAIHCYTIQHLFFIT